MQKRLDWRLDFEIKKVMGDLNLNYLIKSEKQILDTILCPYEVYVLNKSNPTCYCDNMSLIDYIKGDKIFPYYLPMSLIAQSNWPVSNNCNFSYTVKRKTDIQDKFHF